jgi:twinkle protein
MRTAWGDSMADLSELKARINADVERVARHLLPGGRREGNEFRAGSVAGEKGQSLAVHLNGDKAGVWADFETGESGDLVDLWQLARGLDLKSTLAEIRAFLGVSEPIFQGPKVRKTYRKPERPKCKAPAERVRDYLVEDRNIPQEVITAYRIGEANGGATIVFPSTKGGELLSAKYLAVDRDANGKKVIRVESGCRPILFGWQVIDDNAREVTITEGEIDAMSMFAYGHPALSVPFGGGKGGKQSWIDEEYPDLDRFETIFLAMDMDEEGQAAAAEIANRLGRYRCRIVKLPRKDANECLVDGISKEDIDHCIRAARTLDPDELRPAEAFTDDVVRAFHPASGSDPGYRLPWSKLFNRVLFRPGEVTVWQGATGAGKSQVVSHACVESMDQGARICIASLEMAPRMLLTRMIRQATGTGRPTDMFVRQAFDWMAGKLWLFSVVGKSKTGRLLEVFEYARRRYGVDVFIVDSFMRLGIRPDDYAGQEEAMFGIVDWAVASGVHVHLVVHSRKSDRQRGDGVPGSEDVKGTSEIGSNAANIIAVWRNRRHEETLAEARQLADGGSEAAKAKLAELEQVPGVVLNVSKQRNGDWEGKAGLFFDTESYRYRGPEDSMLRTYVETVREGEAA